ncbi:hypothetical protein L1278_003453 [Pontibacter sp. HSC-36F09]|nr:hypothetical protein [Pontibacter sp. HSC-36F09]
MPHLSVGKRGPKMHRGPVAGNHDLFEIEKMFR